MATGYEDALNELYRAAHDAFVTERARLSAELKTSGDKPGAGRLAKLRRPPLSAWVINQLWWHAREEFEELFSTAERLRAGDLAAGAAHRKAVTALAGRASSLLEASGHAATEATLRRVTGTLSALAATGGFDPDPPGALTGDRDPPGFGASGMIFAPSSSGSGHADSQLREEAGEQAAESAAERRLRKQERAKKQAEHQRILVTLRAANREAEACAKKIDRLRAELGAAEEQLEKERARISELETRRLELETED
jgi:hypothetical protein